MTIADRRTTTAAYRAEEIYFFDTEFIEDGQTIDLISIGVVTSGGRELYAVNSEAKLALASTWVRDNVFPHLPAPSDPAWMTRKQIVEVVREFVIDEKPKFWAYYADYDWVAFCQLFGTMMDLPPHFPRFCMDLKQLSVSLGSPKHPEQKSGEHNALEDARWNRDLYKFLEQAGLAYALDTADAELTSLRNRLAELTAELAQVKADQ